MSTQDRRKIAVMVPTPTDAALESARAVTGVTCALDRARKREGGDLWRR